MARKTRGMAALAALCAGALLTVTGCGGGSGDASGDDKTITWWHNSNEGEGMKYYAQVAKDFEAAHPGVDVQVRAMEHEDMLTKLDAAFQKGDPPDVYMERGGGELRDHVDAGLTRDLSKDAAAEIKKIGGSVAGWQVDGKTYALPFSVGVVGFWYNKSLFKKAGITTTPTTVDELIADFGKLRKAGIVPASLGAKDKWPAAHYWYYAAVRQCDQDTLESAMAKMDFSDQCFVQAGETVKKIIDAKPFNNGFENTPAQSGASSASGLLATGKVAMELAGHWEPGVMNGLTEDGKGLGKDTGWFPFPQVEGGEGDPDAQLGGGDAWGVSETAPDVAVDFVKYLLSAKVQKGFAERNMGLPTIPAATDSVADPALASLLKVRDKAPYVQLYFDTALGERVGGANTDVVANMFAGTATPEDVVSETQDAADKEK